MATHYLINKEIHSFLIQQLDIFYPLKDLRSLLISKFPSESLNPSRSSLKCFIIFTSHLILSYVFYFYLFPGLLEFWCLAAVTFKFTVLYNNIYRNLLYIYILYIYIIYTYIYIYIYIYI